MIQPREILMANQSFFSHKRRVKIDGLVGGVIAAVIESFCFYVWENGPVIEELHGRILSLCGERTGMEELLNEILRILFGRDIETFDRMVVGKGFEDFSRFVDVQLEQINRAVNVKLLTLSKALNVSIFYRRHRNMGMMKFEHPGNIRIYITQKSSHFRFVYCKIPVYQMNIEVFSRSKEESVIKNLRYSEECKLFTKESEYLEKQEEYEHRAIQALPENQDLPLCRGCNHQAKRRYCDNLCICRRCFYKSFAEGLISSSCRYCRTPYKIKFLQRVFLKTNNQYMAIQCFICQKVYITKLLYKLCTQCNKFGCLDCLRQ